MKSSICEIYQQYYHTTMFMQVFHSMVNNLQASKHKYVTWCKHTSLWRCVLGAIEQGASARGEAPVFDQGGGARDASQGQIFMHDE
jgi:hypothetical protein